MHAVSYLFFITFMALALFTERGAALEGYLLGAFRILRKPGNCPAESRGAMEDSCLCRGLRLMNTVLNP